MKNCLQCDTELTHVEGRKQKSFCNVNCRNKYFYAKRKKLIEGAMSHKENGGRLTKQKDIMFVPLCNDNQPPDENTGRIKELEAELKFPPKNPMIGLKAWVKIREDEISKLKQNAPRT